MSKAAQRTAKFCFTICGLIKMKILYKKWANILSIIWSARRCYHAERNTDSLL
jgi:hypothetical protein